jgi:two-component system cell cycle response regulator DivK
VGDELILIVEDNPMNLKLTRDLLDSEGYRTVCAETAEEGLELAATQQPKLVLMDVQLPGMDGVSALKRLREGVKTAAIPVVALTAFAMKDDRARFLTAGFDGYMEKPIDVHEFRLRVRGFLRHGRGAARQ